jgi:hypothetical protein
MSQLTRISARHERGLADAFSPEVEAFIQSDLVQPVPRDKYYSHPHPERLITVLGHDGFWYVFEVLKFTEPMSGRTYNVDEYWHGKQDELHIMQLLHERGIVATAGESMTYYPGHRVATNAPDIITPLGAIEVKRRGWLGKERRTIALLDDVESYNRRRKLNKTMAYVIMSDDQSLIKVIWTDKHTELVERHRQFYHYVSDLVDFDDFAETLKLMQDEQEQADLPF